MPDMLEERFFFMNCLYFRVSKKDLMDSCPCGV